MSQTLIPDTHHTHRHPQSQTQRTGVARRVVLTVTLAIALLAGCSSASGTQDATPAEPAVDTTTVEAPAPSTTAPATPEADEDATDAIRIARSTQALTVRNAPDDAAPVVTELPPTTVFGSPRALLVVDDADGWLEVQVPARPNNGTGWIEEGQVDLVEGTHAVTVDLAARHLTVTQGDEVVLETAVAIGAPDAPTPTGTFAIVDRLQTPDAGGPYGPFALGLGGFSETLSEFGGGNGQIAIHGTDAPTSIGQNVSHGCIRVPNEVVLQLADLLPLGTPVTIS